jgi:predicted nucleotidyltransferase
MRTNIFNADFQEFIEALNRADVKYVLVGGYSVILHGYSRTTGDMDIWVEKSVHNYQALINAFQIFGMPIFDMTASNFLHNPKLDVFTFGRPPVAIDIITQIKGLVFEETYRTAIDYEIDDNTKLSVKLIHLQNLIQAKQAAGRARDINDIENLPPQN